MALAQTAFEKQTHPGLMAAAAIAVLASAGVAHGQAVPVAVQASTLPFEFAVTTAGVSRIQGQVSSSGVIWTCKGRTCSARARYPGFGVRACHELAMKVGPVRAFRLVRQPPTLARVKGYPFSAGKLARCNQGLAQDKSDKAGRAGGKSAFTPPPILPPAGGISAPMAGSQSASSANRARQIGEASGRMKQARELQRLHDLGSPVDQAMGHGASGQQDCRNAADRANCLRGNLGAGKAPAAAAGHSMRDCIMGPNPQNCFNSGGSTRPGHLSSGPAGDPRGQVKDPRGVSAVRVGRYDTGPVDDWSGWVTSHPTNGTVTRSRQGHDRQGNLVEEFVFLYDDGQSAHVIRVTETDAEHDRYKVSTFTEMRDEYDEIMETRESTAFRTRARVTVTDPDDEGAGQTGQAAPDSASSGPADTCNWNPALGKCTAPAPDPRGNTSQPGPGHTDTGILGRNAPKTDLGAAINCGDASKEACNRAGAGLSNAARPLEHKDPGPALGSPPH